MESRNPVFSRRGFGQQQQAGWAPSAQTLQGMYDAPAYAPPQATRPMTIDDVVVRSAMSLGALAVTGTLAWVLDLPPAVALIGVVVALVLWAIITFGNKANAATVLGYAAAYGLAVGVISHAFETRFGGIVLQAVVGTALAFGGMLGVYSARIIRVTPRFTKFVIGAGFALVGLMLLNLIVGIFNGTGFGLRGADSPLAYVFSVAAILVGCFFLLLDFDSIEKGVRAGAPEKFAWYCAFGLTLSLIWIYLEILNLLSYFRE